MSLNPLKKPGQPAYPGCYTPVRESWRTALGIIRKSLYSAKEGEYSLDEDEEMICLRIPLPGYRKEDLLVSMKNDRLRVTALRREPVSGKPDKWATCCSSQNFRLPKGADPDFASAEYNNGMLKLCFPRVDRPVRNHIHRLVVY